MKRKYALVIGGTGMLKRVSQWLSANHYFVSVLHRNPKRFASMKNASLAPENLHAIQVDYHDEALLQVKIREAFKRYGYPDLIISWIHRSAPRALSIILNETKNRKPWRLFHIQGSSSSFKKENTSVPYHCEYRRVYLGFVMEKDQSRWLTHNEIAQGIMQAIQNDCDETIIGTLEPWDQRP